MPKTNDNYDMKKLRSKIGQTWTSLSDDEVASYERDRGQFLELIHRKYGLAPQQVNNILDKLERACLSEAA